MWAHEMKSTWLWSPDHSFACGRNSSWNTLCSVLGALKRRGGANVVGVLQAKGGDSMERPHSWWMTSAAEDGSARMCDTVIGLNFRSAGGGEDPSCIIVIVIHHKWSHRQMFTLVNKNKGGGHCKALQRITGYHRGQSHDLCSSPCFKRHNVLLKNYTNADRYKLVWVQNVSARWHLRADVRRLVIMEPV